MRYLCRFITILIWFGGLVGAIAQPIAPEPLPADVPAAPTTPTAVLAIQPTTHYASLHWDGRALDALEMGIEAEWLRHITVGAYYRNTEGNGRSAGTRYDAEGWRLRGELPLWTERPQRPAVALFAEYLNDKTALRVNTQDLEAEAWPSASMTGIGLQAHRHRGALVWHAWTGRYTAAVDDEPVATVYLAGGGLEFPLTARLRGTLDLTAYHEDYDGGYTALELSGDLLLYQSTRSRVLVGGHYFPRGIPMAGTVFSPASSIGMIYGSSAAAELRSQAMGYLTLAGEISF